ncbi:hypothetical protein GCM10010424_73540 [Streptomyces lienomycini]
MAARPLNLVCDAASSALDPAAVRATFGTLAFSWRSISRRLGGHFRCASDTRLFGEERDLRGARARMGGDFRRDSVDVGQEPGGGRRISAGGPEAVTSPACRT